MIILITFIILIFICLIVSFISYTIFQEYIIRINEAEIEIDSMLRKKYDLLNNSNDIIKNFINNNNFDLLNEIRNQKLNNFEFNLKMHNSLYEYKKQKKDNDDLMKNDDFIKIDVAINEVEAELIASRNYYNDVINKYNNLLSLFPCSLIAKIFKYQLKEIFQ